MQSKVDKPPREIWEKPPWEEEGKRRGFNGKVGRTLENAEVSSFTQK
jgi:hypothetical protein